MEWVSDSLEAADCSRASENKESRDISKAVGKEKS